MDRAWQLQTEIQEAYELYQFQTIYQKVVNFCSLDLGGFYLDIVKDRQYTAKHDCLARRSAQTAMFHVIEAMVRWLAPITSFTAEEIWQALPGQRSESVFLETWYQQLFPLELDAEINTNTWESIMAARASVSKELEQWRSKGAIGSSLNAEIELYCDQTFHYELGKLADELHFVFITSKCSLHAIQDSPADSVATEWDGLKLRVVVSEQPKCVRCWHQRADVGKHPLHPELCGRCLENVQGDGETRRYA